jgi:hypothetical protein
VKKTVVIGFLALFLAAPSFAQSTTDWDVSGGLSWVRDEGETFTGWLVSGGVRVTPLIDIVGEIGGNRKSFEDGVIDSTISFYNFMAGPRVASRSNAAFTPYGQFLFGAVRGGIEVEGVSTSETDLAIQPGIGLDWWIQPTIGFRVGADYRRVFTEGEGTNQSRFHFGIVFKGGGQ